MRIVPVTSDHFDDWLAMRQALYSGLDLAYHRQEMDAIVASPEMACFIGESDTGGIVGMIELSLRNVVDGCLGSPVGYIEGLYVKAPFRGLGYGGQLVAFAESWSARAGCKEIATDTEVDNTSAQAYFRRAGFAETWRIVQFKRPIPNL